MGVPSFDRQILEGLGEIPLAMGTPITRMGGGYFRTGPLEPLDFGKNLSPRSQRARNPIIELT